MHLSDDFQDESITIWGFMITLQMIFTGQQD